MGLLLGFERDDSLHYFREFIGASPPMQIIILPNSLLLFVQTWCLLHGGIGTAGWHLFH